MDATRERQVQTSFNFELINEQLPKVELFTDEELATLSLLHNEFRHNMEEISANEYRKGHSDITSIHGCGA